LISAINIRRYEEDGRKDKKIWKRNEIMTVNNENKSKKQIKKEEENN
jgi:hypothetical protein